jgi:hypothetical protein
VINPNPTMASLTHLFRRAQRQNKPFEVYYMGPQSMANLMEEASRVYRFRNATPMEGIRFHNVRILPFPATH